MTVVSIVRGEGLSSLLIGYGVCRVLGRRRLIVLVAITKPPAIVVLRLGWLAVVILRVVLTVHHPAGTIAGL